MSTMTESAGRGVPWRSDGYPLPEGTGERSEVPPPFRDDPGPPSPTVPSCAHPHSRGPSPAMEEDGDMRRVCLDCGRRI